MFKEIRRIRIHKDSTISSDFKEHEVINRSIESKFSQRVCQVPRVKGIKVQAAKERATKEDAPSSEMVSCLPFGEQAASIERRTYQFESTAGVRRRDLI